MPKVFRLVYCEFCSTDVSKECDYYTDVLGARVTDRTADGVRYLSLGLDHHNIALRPGEAAGLTTTGFQVEPSTSLDDLSKTFDTLGLHPQIMTDARPGVEKLVEVADVVGFRFQFFAEMAAPAPGFAASGVVPNRLGHIALLTPRADELIAFFTEALGFDTTDWFAGLATFLTCNHDHHVMNIVNAPITKLHHIAFELRGSGHQYAASDFVARAGHPILWGPSRHTAGHNYASYHFDPDRTLIELYADMDVWVPELGYFEPRPWHEALPQKPRIWPVEQLNAWGTDFLFDFSKA